MHYKLYYMYVYSVNCHKFECDSFVKRFVDAEVCG